MSSYLTDTATLEFDPSGGNNNQASYEYTLPHTKAIDLIGEEFVSKSRSSPGQQQSVIVETLGGIPMTSSSSGASLGHNVVLVNTSTGTFASNSHGVPIQVQQILQQAQNQVSMGSNIVSVALSQACMSGLQQQHQSQQNHCFTLASSGSNGQPLQVLHPNEYSSFQTNSPTSVTVDLPSIHHGQGHQTSSSAEENGVLLCNLDDLSRYIPENFYSDFTLADSQQNQDYLQTVVAGKAMTTTTVSSNSMSNNHQPQSITIQLPTQPQPIQGVKTVTYVNQLKNNNPGKVTQYAYTPSGERIAIHGLPPEATKPGSTLQVQVKGGGMQTLQLSALEPSSKLTVLQEFPEGSKVVIQDGGKGDSISSILEEMKQQEHGDMAEYATAIPVAVTSDPKKTTIKRVSGPNSTVFLPKQQHQQHQLQQQQQQQQQSRIIFAGNTLPQGAIPIQINGLNAIPITAAKSIPFTLSTLTTSINTSPISSSPSKKSSPNNNNNKGMNKGGGSKTGGFAKIQSSNLANINKAIGNNKTCNWVFENGEVCGKTFSKSYNLVVHMRMHEDVRPFGCSLCDQTFRQKAHLQRHETTHGIGVKVSSRNQTSSSAGTPAARRKRKRSSRGSTGSAVMTTPMSNVNISANLQQRLARVSEQFGGVKDVKDSEEEEEEEDEDDETSPAPKMRRLSIPLDRCDMPSQDGHIDEEENCSNENNAFQPYIATAEEVAASSRTSPQVLDAAVTAAVNEAISDIQEAIM